MSQSSVIVFPVPGIPPITTGRISGRSRRGYRSIERIVEESGGETIVAARDEEVLVTALDRIRLRYLISYYPQPQIRAGEKAILRVRLSETAAVKYLDALVRHQATLSIPAP